MARDNSTINDMRKQIFYITVIFLIFLLAFTENPYFQQIFALPLPNLSTYENSLSDVAAYLTYENRTHGVRIDFPSNWIVQEDISPENVVAFRQPALMEFGDSRICTLHESSLNNASDSVFPNGTSAGSIAAKSCSFIVLGVFIQDLSSTLHHQNVSLENYSSLQLEYIQNRLFPISELNNYTLSGYPAYMIEYSPRAQRAELPIMAMSGMGVLSDPAERHNVNVTQVWTVQNDKAYIIMAIVSPPGLQDKAWPIIKRIISSFELTN